VPEDQLNDKIGEYAEYIKIVILGLLILAVVWFVVKRKMKKKQDNEA
jgi:cbb3-type cytochrome oxidase subunit 3